MMKRNQLFLALAAAGIFLAAQPGSAPLAQTAAKAAPASTYKVVQGDNVVGIVRKLKYADVSESQMYYAVVKANINTFSVNTVERVTPGMELKIPGQADVKKVNVKEADAYMANLRKAEDIYQEGVAAEKKGDMKTATTKYLASAKIGHALADLKLGQLYDKSIDKALPHDLQESIKHYQNARARGRDQIKGPGSRAPNPTN
jgi:Tfp pilus assembly protein FimV